MSSALPRSPEPTTAVRAVEVVLWRWITGFVALIRGVAFWATILLPLAYVPVLSGVFTHRVDLLFGLILLHSLCVMLGHRHTPHQ